MTEARSRWLALYVLCGGSLMVVVDITVVNVALPFVEKDLDFSPASLAWVVNSYLIAFGGLLMLAGRLGDLYGRRRILLLGLSVFVASSVVCGFAQDDIMLIVARFVQGAGGAMTTSVILATVVTMFTEPDERAKAIGFSTFVASSGLVIGLLAGGFLTQVLSWRWVFFVNVPLGITILFLAHRYVPDSRGHRTSRSLDVAGAVLITSALMLIVYTIVKPAAEYGWTAGSTALTGCISIALLLAFVVRETTTAEPLMPLRVFASRNLSFGSLVQVLAVAGMFAKAFIGALFMQEVLGFGPLQIGVAFLPDAVFMGLFSLRYSHRLIARFGGKPVDVVGLAMMTLAIGLLAVAPAGGNYWIYLFPVFVVNGIGQGLAFPSNTGITMSGVKPEDAGLASGLANTAGQVGGAVGLAVLASLAASRTAHLTDQGHSELASLTAGFHLGFLVGSAALLLATIIAATVLRAPRIEPAGPDQVVHLVEEDIMTIAGEPLTMVESVRDGDRPTESADLA